MDGHLGKAKPRVVKFLNQFKRNRAAIGFKLDMLKQAAPEKPEVTIRILDWQPKNPFDQVMIQPANHNSVKRIVTAKLETIHNINTVM